MIFFEQYKEAINSISVVIASLAAIIASIVAIRGINSWRKEARWKRRYELAEEVLVLIYEIRDAIKYIRNPWQTEYTDDSPESKKSRSMKIVFDRKDKYKETFAKLQSLKYRFMVINDENSEILFERVDLLIVDLVTAAWNLDNRYYPAYNKKDWKDEEAKKKVLDKMHELESIIWDTKENTEYDQKVDAVVKDFNVLCKKIINEGRIKFKFSFRRFKFSKV